MSSKNAVSSRPQRANAGLLRQILLVEQEGDENVGMNCTNTHPQQSAKQTVNTTKMKISDEALRKCVAGETPMQF
jgi:hypothetical protein